MFRAWHDRARPLHTVTSVVAALLLMIISLGVGGTAAAQPGNGHGKGAATTHAAPKSHTSTKAAHKQAAHKPTRSTSAKSKSTPAKPRPSSHPAKPTASSHASSGTAGTSGDPKQPQPKSRADDNPGGANGDCGAYCSTRDGSASKNGNGGGKATGKPCAGCVGKADNKNPPGQAPDGSDHNNGYECDGNHGIGKTNPAHTGCAPRPPGGCVPKPGEDANCEKIPPGCIPKPGEDANCEKIPPGCVPKPGEDANCDQIAPCIGTVEQPCTPPGCVPTAGQLPDCSTPGRPRPPAVLGTELTRPPTVLGTEAIRAPRAAAGASAAGVAAPATAQPAQGALPNTGASSLLNLLAAAGAAMVLAGGFTLAMRRRGREA